MKEDNRPMGTSRGAAIECARKAQCWLSRAHQGGVLSLCSLGRAAECAQICHPDGWPLHAMDRVYECNKNSPTRRRQTKDSYTSGIVCSFEN
eukprot:4244839-Pleurochrysis_carterae.AAC.5